MNSSARKYVVETYTQQGGWGPFDWHRDAHEWDSHDMAQLYAIMTFRGAMARSWRVVPVDCSSVGKMRENP